MIHSMTGYCKASAVFGDKTINVEIKTLNSKTMDISARIAPVYREKEMEIRNIISKSLVRGKVDISIWIEKDAVESATPINAAIVENYCKQLRQISDTCNIPLPNDWFLSLLRLPDVLTKVEIQELEESEAEVMYRVLNEALNNVSIFRIQEGKALEAKFNEKLDNIERLLQSIEPYEKERVSKIRERITESLEKLLSVDYDKNRLEQELIYYIEKLDISEEKQRLANHLKYFRETMAGPLGQGKKLGFIAQEMGREINTTGSKSNHAQMQNLVVQMKDELEQIKEQVLNVL